MRILNKKDNIMTSEEIFAARVELEQEELNMLLLRRVELEIGLDNLQDKIDELVNNGYASMEIGLCNLV